MLTVIDYNYRNIVEDHKIVESYIDYFHKANENILFSLLSVNEDEFNKYIKFYGADLLTQANNAAFDGTCTDYFDFENFHDMFNCQTRITGHFVKLPMILFKAVSYDPACATCYYVNTLIVERYKECNKEN